MLRKKFFKETEAKDWKANYKKSKVLFLKPEDTAQFNHRSPLEGRQVKAYSVVEKEKLPPQKILRKYLVLFKDHFQCFQPWTEPLASIYIFHRIAFCGVKCCLTAKWTSGKVLHW